MGEDLNNLLLQDQVSWNEFHVEALKPDSTWEKIYGTESKTEEEILEQMKKVKEKYPHYITAIIMKEHTVREYVYIPRSEK